MYCRWDYCFTDNTQVSVSPSDAFTPSFSMLLLLLYVELADIHQVTQFAYSAKPLDSILKIKHIYIPLR